MAGVSAKDPCPCGSGYRYAKCCRRYHRGEEIPPDALRTMKSRYSAYAVADARYIMETTHRDNPDYGKDPLKWREEIERFCREESFESLHIVSFEDGEDEAFVTFIARLGSGTMREKSRFVEVGGRWLYIEAVDIGIQRGVNSSSL